MGLFPRFPGSRIAFQGRQVCIRPLDDCSQFTCHVIVWPCHYREREMERIGVIASNHRVEIQGVSGAKHALLWSSYFQVKNWKNLEDRMQH